MLLRSTLSVLVTFFLTTYTFKLQTNILLSINYASFYGASIERQLLTDFFVLAQFTTDNTIKLV